MGKSIVTGGAGFIGSHLVDALLDKGEEVLVIDDFTSGTEQNLEDAKTKGALGILNADICSKDAYQTVKDFSADTIYHLAAQMNVRKSVEDPVFDADKNVSGTVNILEAAREAGTKKFIFASTGGAIYGEQDVFPAGEDHKCQAESPYGISKHAAELYLEFYARAHGMRAVSMRYANVYGPRQNPKGEAGVVAIFCERLFANQQLRVNGDGEQTRDYVFVGDVVSANLLAAEVDEPGYFTYNVGTGKESSVLDIVEVLKGLWQTHKPADCSEMDVIHGPALAGEQRRSVISSEKLSKTFSWNYQMNLEEGLEVTIKSYIS